jgi:hypothetical protein
MQKYWNFRQILEVYEDPYDVSCVGTAKTVWPPRRCENSIAVYDRVEAGRLLDEMDRHKRLSSSTKSLQELAALLLCKGVHNHLSRPHLSQVVEMSNKWRERVRSYDSMIKKEQEDAAFKTEKALSILKVRAEEIMAKLEEDNLDNVRFSNRLSLPVTDFRHPRLKSPSQES